MKAPTNLQTVIRVLDTIKREIWLKKTSNIISASLFLDACGCDYAELLNALTYIQAKGLIRNFEVMEFHPGFSIEIMLDSHFMDSYDFFMDSVFREISYDLKTKQLNFMQQTIQFSGIQSEILEGIFFSEENLQKAWLYEEIAEKVGRDETNCRTVYKNAANNIKAKIAAKTGITDFFQKIGNSSLTINPKYL